MFAGTRPPPTKVSTSANAVASTSYSPEVARHSTTTTAGARSARYPHRLNFYERPPVQEITVEQFEEWAIDRLRLLADIESAQARNKSHDEIRKLIGTDRAKAYGLYLSSDSAKAADVEAERRKDLYSHFVLRLAFCRSEELRQRFVRAETTLFKIRFETDDLVERRRFVDSLQFGWEVVNEQEKHQYREELRMATRGLKSNEFAMEQFFKVDWTRVTDLVSQRRVLIRAGKAYVPQREELSLVLAEFQSRLTRGLEMTAKALPRLDEDSRLLPVLEHLSTGFEAGITSDYSFVSNGADGELITAEMVPGLAKQSFPMCMRALQDTLVSSKHLKHEGRQQYNLFLKGIGLSVEEALVFWRKSFKLITDDKFNKEYKYNIRHGYGLEGSRKNYQPKSCAQIITGATPGPGQSHGCPFRHYSEANLTASLQSTYSLSPSDLRDIMSSVKSSHYHLACTRLFEIQHARVGADGVAKGDGLGNGDSVDHPNRYFDRSRALYKQAHEGGDVASSRVKSEAGDVKPKLESPSSARSSTGTKDEQKPSVVGSTAMEVDG